MIEHKTTSNTLKHTFFKNQRMDKFTLIRNIKRRRRKQQMDTNSATQNTLSDGIPILKHTYDKGKFISSIPPTTSW